MKKMPAVFCVTGALLFLACGAGAQQGESTPPEVRILVLDDQPSMKLRVGGAYQVITTGRGKTHIEIAGDLTTVEPQEQSFVLPSGKDSVSVLRVHPLGQDGEVKLGKIRYRGDMEVRRKADGLFMAVNHLPVDEYLFGVLSHEISHRWPAESIKAQAIASRTFALHQARVNKKRAYDLRNDIYSQVYGGKNYEKLPTTQAVKATAGQVLTYDGNIFPAYFHATCGGKTEDASYLWDIDIPPLDGGDCGFCDDSKHYRWQKDIALTEVQEHLRKAGYAIGTVTHVRVVLRNGSGRIDRLAVQDTDGRTILVKGKDFRMMLGPNLVRSTNFTVETKDDLVRLDGYGWGHGVGMCQWGARGMAADGWEVDRILKHYYPGTEISTLDDLPASR